MKTIMSLLLVVMTNNNGIEGTHFQYIGFSASKLRDMTNVGLRFTLAGWYQAAKSAKLNRQRTLVDFNTVIGFSGLFVVIHVH